LIHSEEFVLKIVFIFTCEDISVDFIAAAFANLLFFLLPVPFLKGLSLDTGYLLELFARVELI
jgi:hypothetical protein